MKVSFLSVFAFDANISLINSLKKKCDVYFYTEALHKVYNYIDINQLDDLITNGTKVEQIKRFEKYIPLDRTFVIKGTRLSNIFKKLYNSYLIDKEIKKNNPEVVIIDSASLTYLFTAIRLRKKTLLIVHDPFIHSGEKLVVENFIRRFFFKIIKNKILLNSSQKDKFINYYNQKPNHIFESFLSVYDFLTFFAPNNLQEKLVGNSEEFNILFFGRISPYKGIKVLLEAYSKIYHSNNYPNITLTIAGSGTFDFDLESYKNIKSIKFLNQFIEPEELSKLIMVSSVVVCPYTDATQSGVVMSAFAFKKPVIATNVGGLPEMVTHLKTGIIIPKNNTNSLVEAIIELYENPQLISNFENNIEEEYFLGKKSWKNSGELFLKALKKIYDKN